MTIQLTSDNFEQEVIGSDKLVLIDFFADWCGPCQMQGPVIDELAEEMDEIKVCKVDVEEQRELANKFRVMSIPTLIVIKDGEIINRLSGFQRKDQLLSMLAI